MAKRIRKFETWVYRATRRDPATLIDACNEELVAIGSWLASHRSGEIKPENYSSLTAWMVDGVANLAAREALKDRESELRRIIVHATECAFHNQRTPN